MKALSLLKAVYSLVALTGISVALAQPAAAEALQAANSVTAPGKVVYRMKDGSLVDRDMKLEVPARGEGEIVLSGGSIEMRTRNFSTEKKNGRTIFSIVFASVPGAPAGSEMLMEGTYLRDSKRALYYGDIYGRNSQKGETEWSHVGGFMFSAPVGGGNASLPAAR